MPLPKMKAHFAPPHCGQQHAPRVSTAAHTAAARTARVAPTHLNASGQAAIAEHWETLRERRRHLKMVAELERLMRAVRFGAVPATHTAWIDPVIRIGEPA